MDVVTLKKTLVWLEVKETVLILAASVILPFVVHLLPAFSGIPAGAMLLPMFYAPFIAVILFRPHVAVISALLAPTLNSLLTGLPEPEKIGVLTTELVVFSVLSSLIQRRWRHFPGTALLAYLLSVLSVTWVRGFALNLLPQLTAIDFFLNTIVNSLPGLVVLVLLNIFLLRIQPKYNDDRGQFFRGR